METTENKREAAKETARVEAFSDGVFAIAITLLILEIHVPEINTADTLLHSLMHEWASFLAFTIGFFTILICWINHHYMFHHIQRTDGPLLLLNGFKLLVVTVTPFATSVLAEHIKTDWAHQAVIIYCFNFAFMGLAMTGIWRYAAAKGFVQAKNEKVMRAYTRLYTFASIFSTSIWLVSFISIWACLLLSAIMFGVFIFPQKTVDWQLTFKAN